MAKTRVLLLGNDPQINSIEFDRLAPDVVTLGLNRIWLKHIPNYLFFNDFHILKELENLPEIRSNLIQNSTVYSSDWLYHTVNKKSVPPWVKVHNRINRSRFPDSATTALSLFTQMYSNRQSITYYIAGVSLLWQEPSHFWKELDYSSLNQYDRTWYSTRFLKMFENFRILKNTGISAVSVHPASALNKIFRYESIDTLYKRKL